MIKKIIIPLGFLEYLVADPKDLAKSCIEGYGKDLMRKTTKRKRGITKLAFCADCADYRKCVGKLYRGMKPLYRLSKKQRERQKEKEKQILDIFQNCKYRKEVLKWIEGVEKK